MKILVVDDEQRIRELIGQYLTVAGYDVENAKDGIEALTKISKGDIDLCILDVMTCSAVISASCSLVYTFTALPLIPPRLIE